MASTSKSAAKTPVAAKPRTAVSKKHAGSVKTAAGKKAVVTLPAIEFKLFAPEAKEVSLVGDFCDWQRNECPMRRSRDGSWNKRLKLNPGRYEYRFVVDGQWWTDPENPNRQQNPYGQDNSVLIVP